MIVYRQDDNPAAWRPRAQRLLADIERARRSPSVDAFRSLLIEYGELESGIADALQPECDGRNVVVESLREAGLCTGRLLYRAWRGLHEAIDNDLDVIATTLCALESERIPAAIPQPVSEGYAFYSLYPEMYLGAAERVIGPGVRRVVCIGIRSIGTGLSSAVAAVGEARNCELWSMTVRPRGHPWQRELRISRETEKTLRAWAGALFCIVDEGPGLSGSSFASVYGWLRGLGIAESDIVLFPSSNLPAGQLRSEDGRHVWAMARKSVASFDEVWLDEGQLFRQFHCDPVQDLSAGQWRALVYDNPEDYPAVQPQHEARKYLCCGRGSGARYVLKFAGLSHYGDAKLERARALAEAGFCVAPLEYAAGFLMSEFVCGVPLRPDEADAQVLDTLARYLATVAELFPLPRPAPWDALLEMIRINSRECLPVDCAAAVEELASYRSAVASGVTVALDGRMLPHEWIRTRRGLLKTDALDHHSDHFFPGCQDLAWDVAATIVEFGLDSDATDYFLARLNHHRRDAELSGRLPFYFCAYLAYRTGYATLCSESMAPGADRDRFAAAAAAYRLGLQAALMRATGFFHHASSKKRLYDKGSDPAASPAPRALVS